MPIEPIEGAASGPSGGEASPPGSPPGSTDSHHPASESLSELLRKPGAPRRTSNSDILQILAKSGSGSSQAPAGAISGISVNTDDAPTIITHNRQQNPPQSLPLIASTDQPSIAGKRLGHFELIEAIGQGGMAAVLRARDLELGRIVALKILPPEAARDPESVTRFKQEARAAAMLDHENVARAYYCGEDQGLHFIAFEFVEGVNLRQLIERQGTVPPGDCIRYMIQVAAGLNHAAERGVVHRDIKPSNIIITPDGRAKIVDMGLARHLDSLAVNGGVTQSGVTLGTFDYISPEQALDPRRADVRSDIYSLGCAFYHALTGRPPVPEGTAAKKLHAHQHVDPLDPRLLNPAIPDGLAAILSGMMAKNPDQRFQTPMDLIAHLKGLMEQLKLNPELMSKDAVVQGVPANQSVLPEPPRLRLSLLIAAAAVALAIAAFAMSTGDSGPQPSQPPWLTDPVGRGSGSQQPAVIGNVAQAADEGNTIRSVRQLVEVLSSPNAGQKVQLKLGPGEFDFSQEYKEGIALQGKELELSGATSGQTKFILMASQHGNLTIKADSLAVRNIRFRLNRESTEANDGANTGHSVCLAIQATKLLVEDCVFRTQPGQLQSSQSEDAGVALSISGGEATPADVDVHRCAFANMGIALLVPARSRVSIDDSGFAPRRSVIQVQASRDDGIENAPAATTFVKLSRSSFILEPRSAVVEDLNAGDTTNVTAGYCVFASAGRAQERPSDIPFGTILNVAKPAMDVQFAHSFSGIAGQRNAYYRVNPLAVTADETQSLTFDQCKASKLPIEDRDAVVLTQRPWYTNPFDVFEKDPWSAFALRIDKEPNVFVKDDPRVIGAQFHNDPSRLHSDTICRAYPTSLVRVWPPVKPDLSEMTFKVWDPDLKEGEAVPPGTYSELGDLLRHARPNEEIRIKHNGLLRMPKTIDLEPAPQAKSQEFHLTFRPAEGCKPILTGPSSALLDQSLFKLISGEVTFDGLQFLLEHSLPKNHFEIAALTILGGKGCKFTNCVFTLAEKDDQIATVVRIADPDKVMMAMNDGATRPTPEITLDQCLIRGKGRGIWVEASRMVKLTLNHTLTAINGPLIMTEPAGKMMPGAKSVLTLNRVTAFAGGPLLEMKGGGKVSEMRPTGVVPFEVHTDECLFADVPGAGRPLVELHGIEADEVKSGGGVLEWQVKRPTRYANFDDGGTAMTVWPTGEGSMQKDWNWDRWIAFAGEPAAAGKRVGKVMFARSPGDINDLGTMKPRDIEFQETPEMKLDDAGVNWKELPTPWQLPESRP